MATLIHTVSGAGYVQPAQEPGDARQDAVQWDASITVTAGDMVAIRTDTKKATRYVAAGGNGTGTGVGIAMYSGVTDANGKFFTSGVTTASPINTGDLTAPIWKDGIWDLADLKIGGVAASSAQVVTAFGGNVRVLHNGFHKIR